MSTHLEMYEIQSFLLHIFCMQQSDDAVVLGKQKVVSAALYQERRTLTTGEPEVIMAVTVCPPSV